MTARKAIEMAMAGLVHHQSGERPIDNCRGCLLALLKLIGAPNRVILSLVIQQAVLLVGLGFGIAYLVGRQVFPVFL